MSQDEPTLLIMKRLYPRSLRIRTIIRASRRLVGMVQATSGLEGQAVDKATVREMTRRTVRELLQRKGT